MKKTFAVFLALCFLVPSIAFGQASHSCPNDASCTDPAKPHCCSGTCQALACTPGDPEVDPNDGTINAGNAAFGFGAGSNLEKVAGKFKPATTQTLEARISSIIAVFLSFLGVIFLILMIYAGFNWMTAAGDEERITKSKETIRSAIIGLVIVIAAYGLSVFIIERIWGAAA